MRVLHMSSESGWRGGEQQLAYLLKDLSDRSVHNVLAARPGSALQHFSHETNTAFYQVNFSNSFDLLSAFKISRICRRENIDLIHLHTSKAHGVGVLSTWWGNKLPMVLSRRVAFLPGKNAFSRWKYNHPAIRRIICVSAKITAIMKAYVEDGSKCTTVYSGIELCKFVDIRADRDFVIREFKLDPSRCIVINIGALDTSKDHFTFIRTIEILIKAGRPVQGLVLGDGALRKALEAEAEEKGLSKHIVFAGYRSDVKRILLSSDIFMMTSREEGLGTSILDAFLARIPVVATDTGGIPEIVRHEDTGLLAPPQDPVHLSGNIVRLLEDGALRQRVIDRAYEVVQRFSRATTSVNTMKIYEEVLSKSV
jgi:glycosyltransferase involved in cell wall biosynthesis